MLEDGKKLKKKEKKPLKKPMSTSQIKVNLLNSQIIKFRL